MYRFLFIVIAVNIYMMNSSDATIYGTSSMYKNEKCSKTIIRNDTETWNANDEAALKRATFVCSNDRRYEDQPCLKYLWKKEERRFIAICGI